jgi:xanthine/uracil permease
LYFCWPVIIHTSLPFLSDFNAIEYILLGAGSLLWLASCVLVSALLLITAAESRLMRSLTVAVGWLLSWPLLVIAGVWLQASIEAPSWFAPYLSWLDFYLAIPGTITWLATCYGLYDYLFTMLEARWPAKDIRKILNGILRSLLYHHHSS